jgi:hypothetical protein
MRLNIIIDFIINVNIIILVLLVSGCTSTRNSTQDIDQTTLHSDILEFIKQRNELCDPNKKINLFTYYDGAITCQLPTKRQER